MCYKPDMTAERFDSIETALAHHDRQIQDLSAMIAAQWQEIDRLKRLLEGVQTRVDDLADAPPANARPPHY